MELEDKIYSYLQDIYKILGEIYKYTKEIQSDNFRKIRYIKTGSDGFDSSIIYFQDITFKVTDRYTNSLYFNYSDALGEIFLPPSLDGLFYASRVILYDNIESKKSFLRKKIKSEIGVKQMVDSDIVNYIEIIHDKLLKYQDLSKEKVKVK